jgi:hypothetical protein
MEKERGREIEREKRGGRNRESEKQGGKERGRERERERNREGDRERNVKYVQNCLFLKGMTGALAPFSYLVIYIQ